jgi:putative SOS response-associated peptidase YedK
MSMITLETITGRRKHVQPLLAHQGAGRDHSRATLERTGNLPPMSGIFPDYPAPIVRNEGGERVLTLFRWGMPSPQFALKGKDGKPKKADPGVTNIRNTSSPQRPP